MERTGGTLSHPRAFVLPVTPADFEPSQRNLYGIDNMPTPGHYLHSDEGIRLAMAAKLGG